MAKKLIFFAVAAVIIAVAASCLYSLYAPEPVHYRPMCYFSDSLFVTEHQIDGADTDEMEFLLKIDFCVGTSNAPKNNGECNYPNMLGAEIYRDKNDIFYLKYTDGNVVKLEGSRIYGEEITILNS